MASDHYDPLLVGSHAPLSEDERKSKSSLTNHNDDKTEYSKVKVYRTTLSLAKIEHNVPPNILLQFISSYLVQTPTIVQILQYYKKKLWGQEKLKTSRILCSLAVNLEPIAAKRAAVKWAERQLEEVSSASESSEYKRLIHGWHLALQKAEMDEVANIRRKKKTYALQKDEKVKEFELIETKFEKGREMQRQRFDQVLEYHKKYEGIGRTHGKIRKMQEVLDAGNKRKNAKTKFKQMASMSAALMSFGSPHKKLKGKVDKKLKHLRTMLRVRDKLKGSLKSSRNNSSSGLFSPIYSPPSSPLSQMPSLTSTQPIVESNGINDNKLAANLVPARPEYDTAIASRRKPSVNIKIRNLSSPTI
jgi:hypothetical protein